MEYLIGKEVIKRYSEDTDSHQVGDTGYAVGCIEDKLFIVCWVEDLALPVACMVDKLRLTGVEIKIPVTEKLEEMLDSYDYMSQQGMKIELYTTDEKVSSS